MIIELLLLMILYSVPLGITLWSLIRSYRQYPSYAVIRVIGLTLLVAGWVYASIPWMIDIDTLSDNQIIIIAHIGSIMGLSARIVLATSFTKPDLSVSANRSAVLSIVFASMLIGIRTIEFLENDDTYFGITRDGDGGWENSYHFLVHIFVILNLVTLFLAFYYSVKNQTSLPSPIINSNLRKLYLKILTLFVIGGTLSMLNQVVFHNYFPTIFLISYIASRLIVLFGFLTLAQYISFNPVFVFQEKSNLRKPVDDGLIGWMVSYNGDMGPDTLIVSNKFAETCNIPEEMFTSFSASVITVIGVTKSFQSTVFMIPFSGKDKFFTINFSFKIKEPSLKDPRLGKEALTVHSILLPVSLVPKLSGFERAKELIASEIKKIDDLQSFRDTDYLNNLTTELLEAIIS